MTNAFHGLDIDELFQAAAPHAEIATASPEVTKQPAPSTPTTNMTIAMERSSVRRPHLHYRLIDPIGAGGTIIGGVCDTMTDLLRDLTQHYGNRLDLQSLSVVSILDGAMTCQ